jgi:hypothetical protein
MWVTGKISFVPASPTKAQLPRFTQTKFDMRQKEFYSPIATEAFSISANEALVQKLVTIHLSVFDFRDAIKPHRRQAKTARGLDVLLHGEVEEHLSEFLDEGWRIASVTPVCPDAGASSGEKTGNAWLAVVLEKN